MLQAIPAAAVGTDGRALEVRYRAAPGRSGLLIVTVLAHAVEGGPDHVRRSELALVLAGERVGRGGGGGGEVAPPRRGGGGAAGGKTHQGELKVHAFGEDAPREPQVAVRL